MIFDCLQTVGPHPLPGMARMTHVPAASVDRVVSAVSSMPARAWILLDAEHERWSVAGCDLVWWGGWIPSRRYLAARGFEVIKGQTDFMRASNPAGIED